MASEVEQKFAIKDNESTRALIALCDCLAIASKSFHLQLDEYYDTPEEQLRAADFTIRLRTVDSKTSLAMKGPRSFSQDGVYSRIELEFEVPNAQLIMEQLDRQGLIRVASIEKRRLEFVIEDCNVAIDTLPLIGDFAEIENLSGGRIDSVRRSLGLRPEDSVKKNYTELLEQHFLKIGLPIRPNLIATFGI